MRTGRLYDIDKWLVEKLILWSSYFPPHTFGPIAFLQKVRTKKEEIAQRNERFTGTPRIDQKIQLSRIRLLEVFNVENLGQLEKSMRELFPDTDWKQSANQAASVSSLETVSIGALLSETTSYSGPCAGSVRSINLPTEVDAIFVSIQRLTPSFYLAEFEILPAPLAQTPKIPDENNQPVVLASLKQLIIASLGGRNTIRVETTAPIPLSKSFASLIQIQAENFLSKSVHGYFWHTRKGQRFICPAIHSYVVSEPVPTTREDYERYAPWRDFGIGLQLAGFRGFAHANKIVLRLVEDQYDKEIVQYQVFDFLEPVQQAQSSLPILALSSLRALEAYLARLGSEVKMQRLKIFGSIATSRSAKLKRELRLSGKVEEHRFLLERLRYEMNEFKNSPLNLMSVLEPFKPCIGDFPESLATILDHITSTADDLDKHLTLASSYYTRIIQGETLRQNLRLQQKVFRLTWIALAVAVLALAGAQQQIVSDVSAIKRWVETRHHREASRPSAGTPVKTKVQTDSAKMLIPHDI